MFFNILADSIYTQNVAQTFLYKIHYMLEVIYSILFKILPIYSFPTDLKEDTN